MRSYALLIICTVVGLGSGLAACDNQSEPADGCGEMTVEKARVTPAHPGSREMLGYFRLRNKGDEAVLINGIASGDFHRAAFQDKTGESKSGDGPRSLAPFTLSAGHTLQLKPDEREVVLYSASRSFQAGDTVTLQLSCGKGHAKKDVAARVVDRDGDLPGHGGADQKLQKALENDRSRSAGDDDAHSDQTAD